MNISEFEYYFKYHSLEISRCVPLERHNLFDFISYAGMRQNSTMGHTQSSFNTYFPVITFHPALFYMLVMKE